jgi:hypothetical protein
MSPPAANEAKAPVNADVRFVAEDQQGNHGQWLAILVVPDFSADLERPACIGNLLRCLAFVVGSDAQARLDGLALALSVPLFGRRDQRGIHDLPGHGI